MVEIKDDEKDGLKEEEGDDGDLKKGKRQSACPEGGREKGGG